MFLSRDRGSTVVKLLCYKSEGRWFDPIDTKSIRSHYGPGIFSASKKNEYQEHSLVVKTAGAVVMKSGNLKFPEPSGPFQACKGTA